MNLLLTWLDQEIKELSERLGEDRENPSEFELRNRSFLEGRILQLKEIKRRVEKSDFM